MSTPVLDFSDAPAGAIRKLARLFPEIAIAIEEGLYHHWSSGGNRPPVFRISNAVEKQFSNQYGEQTPKIASVQGYLQNDSKHWRLCWDVDGRRIEKPKLG